MKFKKNKKRLIMCLILFLTLGVVFIKQQIVINNLKKQNNTLNESIVKAKEKNDKLKEEIKIQETDEYKEDMARERLMLIKPGEILFKDSSK